MLKRFQLIFQTVVNKIEDYPLPLKRYVLLFFAILGFRLSLEFFSNQRLFTVDDVLHIGLWFLFIVLAFMLQLHLFSGVRPDKIIKLVVCCFSIALTAPLIDLVISQGKFVRMNYLSVNSFSDILRSYITIGGASLSRGATLGIRIEIVLLVIASFNYVYIKTGSWLRALVGTWCIYTVLFFSGIFPYLITNINALFGLSFPADDRSSISLLLLLDLLLIAILGFRFNREAARIRAGWFWIGRVVTAIGLFGYGAWLALTNYPGNWQLNSTTVYQFPLLVLWFALLFLYEGYHFRNPQLNTQRYAVQNGYMLLILLTSASSSFHAFFGSVLIVSMLFFLHERPLRFFHIPVLSALFQAGLLTGFLLTGFMSFGAPMIGIPKHVILLTLSVSFSVFLAYIKRFRYIRRKAA